MTKPKKQTSQNYQPPQKIIERYAQILVNFALNSGTGIKKGEVVRLVVPDVAKPSGQRADETPSSKQEAIPCCASCQPK